MDLKEINDSIYYHSNGLFQGKGGNEFVQYFAKVRDRRTYGFNPITELLIHPYTFKYECQKEEFDCKHEWRMKHLFGYRISVNMSKGFNPFNKLSIGTA